MLEFEFENLSNNVQHTGVVWRILVQKIPALEIYGEI